MSAARKKLETATFRRPKATLSTTSSSVGDHDVDENHKPQQQLEDYIYELASREKEEQVKMLTMDGRKETRNGDNKSKVSHNMINTSSNYHHDMNTNGDHRTSSPDLYTQLAQKEKDLILAAELGKALLERNEELTRANERITEEYVQKLELLEQDKHGLRRRLDTMIGEYDSRMAELQADLTAAKREQLEQQELLRQTEKEKQRLIQELMEQNHRLTRELSQASESEEQLNNQIQSLREQFNARRSNLHDHVAQLEGLREEINILTKRKSDLEKRISTITEEREHLSMSLEESSDRILMLEKRNQELEHKIQSYYKEMDELRHANSVLHNKLDQLKGRSPRRHNGSTGKDGSSPMSGHQPTSLYNEIEMSSSSSIEDELRTAFSNNDSEEDIDCDVTLFSSFDGGDEHWKLKQELMEIYQQLRRLCRDLHRRRESTVGQFNASPDSGVPSSPEDISSSQLRSGLLTGVVKDLHELIKDIFPDEDGPCAGCRSVAVERNELDKLKKELTEKQEIIKRKTDEINELLRRVTIQEVELNAAKEERDNARETLDSDGRPKDAIVNRAFEVRDQAVARKNLVEIELAKSRIEVMHINSQLMEAIQQKVELSQQLEQWQVDMQTLLDDQLTKKIMDDKKRGRHRTANGHTQDGNNSTVNALSSSSLASLVNRGKRLWRS